MTAGPRAALARLRTVPSTARGVVAAPVARARGAVAAPVQTGRDRAQRLVVRADEAAERVWEAKLLAGSMPGPGEMTGILRRNGQPTFTQYAVGQKQGRYGVRSFLPTDRGAFVARLRAEHPEQERQIVEAADRLLAGTHEVFGSGPVDLRRGTRGPGHRLDWRRDPISGERYGLVFSEWRWNVMGMRPGSADVKGPWEVTRAQHLVTVGQAYWLTGDERYAEYFAGAVRDFVRRNPAGLGVHWASNMDVALRVVGWVTALSFFQGSPALTLPWWRLFLRSLVSHGRFMASHLEFGTLDGRIVTSNHYLSNLLGLHWLALTFPGLDAGVLWRGIAERALEHEVRTQLHEDGGDFESSVPYHRLVVEMLLSAWALSAHNGTPLSDGYRERLVKALEFVRLLREPSGRLPQVGDADDGRAHIFSDFGRWQSDSMDHLLVAGAHVLGRPDLAQDVPHEARVEALLWGPGAPEQPATVRPENALLPDSGLAVVRAGDTYLMMTNGPVGTEGFGNHKHNDQLALEWAVGEQPLLVDAGSYTYSQDPDSRNRFRSTAMHNTVMVDDVEQHTFRPEWLFRMFAEGTASLRVADADGARGIEGTHTAYARLDPPLVHTRRVTVLPDGTTLLADRFDQPHGHRMRWQFLLHPGVEANVAGDQVRLTGPAGAGTLVSEQLAFTVQDSWYSPGYGRRQATRSLVAELTDPPGTVRLVLVPGAGTVPHAELRDAVTAVWGDDR